MGRICVYHQGGGNKRRLCLLDRFRRIGMHAYVLRVFRGRFSSPYYGLLLYVNGLYSIIALAEGLCAGMRVFSGASFPSGQMPVSLLGSSNVLDVVPLFTVVSSLELFPFSGFKVATAAGTSAYVIGRLPLRGKVVVKLSSGWQVRLPGGSMAVFGPNSNTGFRFSTYGKAGIVRALGVRPTVRGVAKNPCDHPHGGGEGRGSPPAAAVSPWGWRTKGAPTTNRKVDRLRRRLFSSKKK